MAITPITQQISALPLPPHREVDVQTIFVNKQEAFQDSLAETFITQINGLRVQLNTFVGEMNTTTTQINTNAEVASTSATTASTKASEASTSASQALTNRNQAQTFRNQAETFAQQASASATSVDANNIVHRTGDEGIDGVKTFVKSPIVPTPTTNTQVANKTYVDTLDAQNIKITGNQNITGVKTFSSNPISTATQSTAVNALTRKDYVDGLNSTNVKLSGNQTISGVKTFSSSPIVPTPTIGTQAVNKDYADLKVALASFTGANQSLTQSGYQKLPGKFIIQWGSTITGSNGGAQVNFPITFPNNILNFVCMGTKSTPGTSGQAVFTLDTASLNNSNCVIWTDVESAGRVGYYMAVGY